MSIRDTNCCMIFKSSFSNEKCMKSARNIPGKFPFYTIVHVEIDEIGMVE